MSWRLTLLFLFCAAPAWAEEEAKPSGNPHGLSDEQWEHIQENNVGRAEELVVGDVAPDFDLVALEGNERTHLKSFRGKRPVVLFFGSYT